MNDDHIILMLAEEISCNPRNVFCGKIYGDIEHSFNLYGSTDTSDDESKYGEAEQSHYFKSLRNIEIDYQVSK